MKKTAERMKGFVVGFVLAMVISGTVVMAASGVMLEAVFGVNVVINGNAIVFEEDMQPFIAGGRTFLPVRAIGDALGLPVYWYAGTSTVYIGGRPVSEAELVGRWRAIIIEETWNGNNWVDDEVEDAYIEIFADGTGLIIDEDDYESVSWSLEGMMLHILIEDEFMEELSVHAMLEGDEMIWTFEDFGAEMRITFVRAEV